MNIAMLLEMAADGLGDRIAIGSLDDGVSYARLRDLAQAVAAHVETTGARTLAFVDETSPLVPAALFGAAWAGIAYAPINYRLPAEAREELLERLQPATVADASWLGLPAAPHAYPDEPEQPAVLLFTSGTSAEPKAAVLAHDQLLAYQLNTVEFASAGEEEAVLLAVPPFHIAGVTAVLSSTYAGRRIVPLPRFTADDWLALASAERVTHAFVVPTMLARIVHALEADPSARPPALRHLAYGGARMPAPVLERALALLPETGFVNAYGLTETSSTVCVLGPDDHRIAAASDDPVVRERLGSVGAPVPGIELRVVDAEGADAAPGTVGEILLRGAQVSGDYVGQTSHRHADGWLPTGDHGRLDADGYLFVEGRGDDMIIRGGENVAPAEIEDALLRHPAVSSAAVVGIPDEEWGERVGAMVAVRPTAEVDEEELRAFVHERLGTLKTPEVIVIRDDLPHTATGKILRRQVRADLTALTDTE
jgi:acyl-CoA synthetase (AMP-forming)/AMP-acid ligase II